MTKKMLQFIDIEQETPEKRDTSKRKGDFNEIYKDYITKLQISQVGALNVVFHFAKFIVH